MKTADTSGTQSSENMAVDFKNNKMGGKASKARIGPTRFKELIRFDPNQKLGTGSGGTIVYKGSFGGDHRNVAVKVIHNFIEKVDAIDEIQKLVQCDGHPNIVRYFDSEEQGNLIVVALELCEYTLEQWVKGKNNTLVDNAKKRITSTSILEQITTGLCFLHEKQIVHRDLKPTNILFSLQETSVFVKISDFGISRYTGPTGTSVTITSGRGTEGWMAPEILRFIKHSLEDGLNDSKIKMKKETDIFSLGCIYFYVLTNGRHPFGKDPYLLNHNILEGAADLSVAKTKENLVIRTNIELIRQMICSDPANRPSAKELLAEPIFWDNCKQLQFLVVVSNFIDGALASEDKTPNVVNRELKRQCADTLEKNYYDVIATSPELGWFGNIKEPAVFAYLRNDKSTKSRGKSVRNLIRVIRNLHNHYENATFDEHVKGAMGNMPTGFISYWLNIFPLLIHHVKLAFNPFAEDELFKTYYYRLPVQETKTIASSSNLQAYQIQPLVNKFDHLPIPFVFDKVDKLTEFQFLSIIGPGPNIYRVEDGKNLVQVQMAKMSARDFYQFYHYLIHDLKNAKKLFFKNEPIWTSVLNFILIQHSLDVRNETVEMILRIPGFNLEEEDENGNNFILSAVQARRNMDLIKMIVFHVGVKALWHTNNVKRSALHYAVNLGDREVIKYLMLNKLKPDLEDIHGNTPISLAIQANSEETLDLLLKD